MPASRINQVVIVLLFGAHGQALPGRKQDRMQTRPIAEGRNTRTTDKQTCRRTTDKQTVPKFGLTRAGQHPHQRRSRIADISPRQKENAGDDRWKRCRSKRRQQGWPKRLKTNMPKPPQSPATLPGPSEPNPEPGTLPPTQRQTQQRHTICMVVSTAVTLCICSYKQRLTLCYMAELERQTAPLQGCVILAAIVAHFLLGPRSAWEKNVMGAGLPVEPAQANSSLIDVV